MGLVPSFLTVSDEFINFATHPIDYFSGEYNQKAAEDSDYGLRDGSRTAARAVVGTGMVGGAYAMLHTGYGAYADKSVNWKRLFGDLAGAIRKPGQNWGKFAESYRADRVPFLKVGLPWLAVYALLYVGSRAVTDMAGAARARGPLEGTSHWSPTNWRVSDFNTNLLTADGAELGYVAPVWQLFGPPVFALANWSYVKLGSVAGGTPASSFFPSLMDRVPTLREVFGAEADKHRGAIGKVINEAHAFSDAEKTTLRHGFDLRKMGIARSGGHLFIGAAICVGVGYMVYKGAGAAFDLINRRSDQKLKDAGWVIGGVTSLAAFSLLSQKSLATTSLGLAGALTAAIVAGVSTIGSKAVKSAEKLKINQSADPLADKLNIGGAVLALIAGAFALRYAGFLSRGLSMVLRPARSGYMLGNFTVLGGTISGGINCGVRALQGFTDPRLFFTTFFRSYISPLPNRLAYTMHKAMGNPHVPGYIFFFPGLGLLHLIEIPNQMKESGSMLYRHLAQKWLYTTDPSERARLKIRLDELERGINRRIDDFDLFAIFKAESKRLKEIKTEYRIL